MRSRLPLVFIRARTTTRDSVMPVEPQRLKASIGAGLLSFPVTHFRDDGAFDPEKYRSHIAHLLDHRPAAFFAAGGRGSSSRSAPTNTSG